MKSLKSRVLSGAFAALMTLGVSAPALASWDAPDASDAPDYTTVTSALLNLPVQITNLLGLVNVDPDHIKVVYLEDILSGDELVDVDNTLNHLLVNLQVVNLQNTLNGLDLLNDLTIGDILSDNDVDISDVVAVKVFDDGKVLVFCK
ncbi:uncharacterized protein SOCEGT47_013780 [Sorangium cellulosum]|uniref:Secreted protein n=1 Tax=Sorangium cellulosum TaxID=56 RepID=A0A4V0NCZ6_SORCE|nr:hypothetical protein [Sorangium cellulosum]AUX20902.1 uncharacterized protein SOCEGT47_013780 [Sorangium cellulosum]